MVIKTWAIYDKFFEDDINVLKRLEVSFMASSSTFERLGTMYVIPSLREAVLSFTTTNDEQEVWLKLHFGDRMIHHSTEYKFSSE